MSVPPGGGSAMPPIPSAMSQGGDGQPAPDPNLIKLAQMVSGEAGGEPAAAQQAVAAVAMNRARESGQSLAEVLAAPHQFDGYNAKTQAMSPDHLAPVLANIQGVYAGTTPDPTGGADHFFAPALANPTWGQGPGQMIGHQKFLALGYGGGQPGSPPTAQAPGPAPVAPYQVASNAPTPPPSSPGAAPAPAPAAVTPAGAGAPQAPPHQVVTPDQVALAERLYMDPRTRPEGQAMLLQLQQRQVTPLESPKDMMWDSRSGRYVPMPGTQYTNLPGLSPSDAAQANPFGQVTHSPIPGVQGKVPEGYVLQGGQLVPMGAGAQGAPPNGKASIPPALQKPYMDMLDAWHKGPGYQDYANSVNAVNALETNLKAAMGNNTIVDQAAADATIRAMTGLSARQNSLNAVLEHLPWSEQLKGFISKAVGPDGMNGYITPKVVNEMRQAVHAYADGHRQLAQDEYNQFNGAANRMGFDLGQSLPTVLPQTPIKWLGGGIGGAAGAAGVASPNGQQPAPGSSGLAGVAPGLAPHPAAANSPFKQYPDARQAPDGRWYVQRGRQFFRVEAVGQ